MLDLIDFRTIMSERSDSQFAAMVLLLISAGRKLYQKQVRLESRDVSEGGLVFETSRKIPVDAKIRILVSEVGDLPPEARIEGRVVYRRKNLETGKYAVGVEFTHFVHVRRDELLECIERWEDDRQLTPI